MKAVGYSRRLLLLCRWGDTAVRPPPLYALRLLMATAAAENGDVRMVILETTEGVWIVLVQREVEFLPFGVSELGRASCRKSRGILPRRFIALLPIRSE